MIQGTEESKSSVEPAIFACLTAQLFKTGSSFRPSVMAFAEHTGMSEPGIWLKLLQDQCINPLFGKKSLIEQHKLGEIDNDTFRDGIRELLDVTKEKLSDKTFDACYNAMCTIDDKKKDGIKEVLTFAKENPDSTIIVAGYTNPIQHAYNLGQLKTLNGEELPDNIRFSLSYEQTEPTADKTQLVKNAINNLSEEDKKKEVTVLHSDMHIEGAKQCPTRDIDASFKTLQQGGELVEEIPKLSFSERFNKAGQEASSWIQRQIGGCMNADDYRAF